MGWWIVGGVVAVVLVAAWAQAGKDSQIMSTGTPEQRAALVERNAAFQHGSIRSAMVCPHCQERGNVRCKDVKNKKGISGGNATGALLTGGVSILATGLSRKEDATEAYCSNCQSTWHF